MIESLYPGAFRATLENGLTVIGEEVPSSLSVSVGVWIRVGSRDDPPDRPGLAHFLEHLLFKGTKRRDATRISEEIDAVGGYINGATGKESTFYYADVPADGLPVAIDVLSDLVQHPAFDPAEVEKERGVILEEIRAHDDDPDQYGYDLFVSNLWKDSHPLSRPVLGTRATIRDVSVEEIAAFHRRYYRPANMVVVGCGALNREGFVELVARHFSAAPAESVSLDRTPPQLNPGRNRHPREIGQVQLYFGLPGSTAGAEDRFPLEIVNTVLGGGMSSRLFRLIREERGLAYAVTSSVVRYSDAGAWIIYAGTAPKNVGTVTDITLTELERLRREGISTEELARAKAKLRGHLVLGLETNAGKASRLGDAAINGREILSPQEIVRRVDGIGQEDIARVLEQFVRPEVINLAAIGPVDAGSQTS
ncbi:MAG TPA: insulinase family protein [Candidatus Acetothermia bacterium]|nr:insulinase family protein [Candidatus Bipolaricaulota bacterium]HDJ30288.1 insulinase family protein [Candidatus Acetothermia bacterium]